MKKVIVIFFCASLSVKTYANSNFSQKSINDTSIKSVARLFLNWYFSLYKKDKSFNFTLVKGGDYDSINPYRVDFVSTNAYLQALDKVGLFSPKFIKSLSNYFLLCDENFIKHKQYCGIPMGFEEGVLTRYIDDIGIEENRDNFKMVKQKKRDKTVFVKLKFTKVDFFTFEFTKQNGRWLIDKINGDFPKAINYNYDYNSGCKELQR